jgi:hypothetical protein
MCILSVIVDEPWLDKLPKAFPGFWRSLGLSIDRFKPSFERRPERVNAYKAVTGPGTRLTR